MSDQKTNAIIAAAWRANARPLAQWAWTYLVNRTDIWGGYLPEKYRQERVRPDGSKYVLKAVTKPPLKKRGVDSLNERILATHFKGLDVGNIAGLHTTSLENTCKAVWGDVDRHEESDASAEVTTAAATYWFDKLTALGFNPLLIESDGNGGFHVGVIFSTPVAASKAYAFAQWIFADHAERGIAKPIETFPKQSEISKAGNWKRLPGRHHTKDHWSRLWNGFEWIEGDAAINFLIGHTGDPETLIPPEAAVLPQPAPRPTPKPVDRSVVNPNRLTDREVALRALDGLNAFRSEDYDTWLKVGMILYDVDQDLLSEWDRWSRQSSKYAEGDCDEKWPSFGRKGGSRAGLGSLVKMAREDGAKIFPNEIREANQAPKRKPLSKMTLDEALAPDPDETPPGLEGAAGAAGADSGPPENHQNEGDRDDRQFDDQIDENPVFDPEINGACPEIADRDPIAERAGRVAIAFDLARQTEDLGPLLAITPILAELDAAALGQLNFDLRTWKQEKRVPISIPDLTKAIRLARQQKVQQRRRLLESGVVEPGEIPEILCAGRRMRDVTRDVIVATAEANEPPKIFIRSGGLTRLKTDEKGRPVIEVASESFVRGRIERSSNCMALNKNGDEVPVTPPLEIVRDFMSVDIVEELKTLGVVKIPTLLGVAESPVVRNDGSILSVPGYDPATMLFYAPPDHFGEINVPENPTRDDINAAVALIYEVIQDFPFENDASRANAIAAMITCPMRPAFTGNVPMALFDKPQPGTGGSLLAETITYVMTGRDVAMLGAPKEEEEWRKQITTYLQFGHPVVIFDNVEHILESDNLCRVLTCTEWLDRQLGSNTQVRLPARTVWMSTGNNVTVGRQMIRRTYRIRLNAQSSQPETRGGFRHPELLEWAKENLSCISSAILTICRAWILAGRPPASTPVVGSFNGWCKAIGGVLQYAGIPDFLGNLEEAREANEDESGEWEAFLLALAGLYQTNTFPISQLEKDLGFHTSIKDALPSDFHRYVKVIPAQTFGPEKVIVDPALKKKLGQAFKKRNEMRFGPEGIYLQKAGIDTHFKVSIWQVLRANKPAGFAGIAGSFFTQTHETQKNVTGENLFDKQNEKNNSVDEKYIPHGEGQNNTPHTPQSPHNFESDDEYERLEREAIEDSSTY